MKLIRGTRAQGFKPFFDAFKQNEDVLLAYTCERTSIWYSVTGMSFDRAYCEANNIPLIPFNSTGGTIVLSPGDLAVCVMTSKPNKHHDTIQNGIVKWLQSKKIPAERVRNDIVIDGKKISGSGTLFRDGKYISAVFIAIADSTELVNRLTFKKKVKQPTGLVHYNLNAEDVLKEIMQIMGVK